LKSNYLNMTSKKPRTPSAVRPEVGLVLNKLKLFDVLVANMSHEFLLVTRFKV
jgi:hypothetical protein